MQNLSSTPEPISGRADDIGGEDMEGDHVGPDFSSGFDAPHRTSGTALALPTSVENCRSAPEVAYPGLLRPSPSPSPTH